MKGKSCSRNQISFCDERAGIVDKESEVDVYVNFSKAYDNFSHNNLISELMKHWPSKWPVKCAEKWLEC